jgi:hypothetical protein
LLRRKFGFLCACAACSLEGEALARSDARYRRVAEILGSLDRQPPTALVPLVEESYALMAAEGIPVILGKAGWILAIVHLVQNGAIDAAAKWARLGADQARIALGEDSSAYLQFAHLLSEPERS